ncbi:hypothetical protein PILCRDRAFT_821306 [Piloderma croceum F 1598]|uniref:Uncharacterized protein n=1 Tax=Piloderma croceum (strain F 1598) TaxID=765440 RepID=A0A0C3B5L2_PILCF|nr:hypothetical protein PILCRDRAFT_821306 [Piloderma croceum F 1598]
MAIIGDGCPVEMKIFIFRIGNTDLSAAMMSGLLGLAEKHFGAQRVSSVSHSASLKRC